MKFLEDILREKSENGSKSNDFCNQLLNFEFLFYTRIMIIIFEKVEIFNAELQKISLSFQEAQMKI